MKTVQWCPDGNPMNGVPGEVMLLISTDRVTHGYGYGDGWSIIFYHPTGDITLNPGDWVILYDDGSITVEDHFVEDAEVFDAEEYLRAIKEA